jgi:hypothetical protein
MKNDNNYKSFVRRLKKILKWKMYFMIFTSLCSSTSIGVTIVSSKRLMPSSSFRLENSSFEGFQNWRFYIDLMEAPVLESTIFSHGLLRAPPVLNVLIWHP